MGIRGLMTRLVNKTGQSISFHVSNGVCPLRDLPAGRSRSVSLSLIRKRCREHGSSEWPIRVLINGRFHGMHLHPYHHILKMTRIVFRYKWRSDGSCVLIAEGAVETFSNRFFDCCINWQKRSYDEIAEADSTWERSINRGFNQNPDIVERNGNNLQIREVGVEGPDIVAASFIGPENLLHYKYFSGLRFLRSARFLLLARQDHSWSKRIIHAFPKQKMKLKRLWSSGGGGRSIPASVINSRAAIESRKRLQRLLSLRRRVMFNRFLLFGLAFIIVASLHLFRIWLCL